MYCSSPLLFVIHLELCKLYLCVVSNNQNVDLEHTNVQVSLTKLRSFGAL